MNEQTDIFEMGDPSVKGKFFYHREEGDNVKGTYIGQYEAEDSYKNEQIVVMLKASDGEIYKVGIRKTNEILLEELAMKQLGDIIGFKHDGWGDSKKHPGNKFKIIHIYPYRTQGPVDHEWLRENGANTSTVPTAEAPQETPAQTSGIPTDGSVPFESAPKNEMSEEAAVALRNLAKTKGLTSADASDADVDKAIAEFVEVPLTEENFASIITKLSGYTK